MITLLLTGLALAAIAFFFTWLICVKIRNYGFVDVIWSYSVALLAPLYAVMGPGLPLRKWLFAGVGILWSLRLGTYLFRRVLRHHPHEDARYATMRQRWPGPGMFLLFFELQAVIATVLSLPLLVAAFDDSPVIHPLEWAGLALALIALGGEALADRQMARFKADVNNRTKVCEDGLWAYSRHPNYFFEAVLWVGFCLAALPLPMGWITISCPLMMLYFLFKVTGIPLTEEHAVLGKGEPYRDYQRRVSAFIPWFPKKSP